MTFETFFRYRVNNYKNELNFGWGGISDRNTLEKL
jgi:hypothetical protein